MKPIYFLFLALLASVAPASAQTTVIIGPQSLLAWDTPGLGPALAQSCTYTVAVGTGPQTPLSGPVTCVAPVAPATDTTCTVNLTAQTSIPIGSNSLTMTATCSGQTSLPSLPYAYVDVVVPIPKNVRFK